ncbi:hypothetical protein [Pelomonas sp. Root662]|nr:hypothetical protein [Pelomonas sp. Root662]
MEPGRIVNFLIAAIQLSWTHGLNVVAGLERVEKPLATAARRWLLSLAAGLPGDRFLT